MSLTVEIFGKDNCPFCDKAKALAERQGHEYTYKNLEFCLKFNPNNSILKEKKNTIKLSLKNKKPTVPTTIEEEIKTNIFFRFNDPDVKKAINLENSSDIEIFTKLRDLKDSF